MIWVMATLGVAMSLQLLRMPIWVVAVTLAPFAWRLCAELRGWRPPPAPLRFGAIGLALAALFLSYGNIFGRSAAVSLLTVMLSMKLLETYRIRDARVIVSFSLFLCATQYLFGQGILMPLYGAGVIAAAMIALAQLQRREAFAPCQETPPLGRTIYAELGFSFRILALALPAALALFLLFPRWSSPLWGVPESTLDARTGLSGSMSPGSIQQLFMDDSAAFRVDFHGRVPPQSELYWRGPVFWDFDGRQWEASFWSKNLEARARPSPPDASLRYTIQLEPNERHWLFALDYPAIVPHDARLTMDYLLYRKTSVTQLLRYEMASDPDFVDSPELSNLFRDAALELPRDLNPETRSLVERWRRDISDDRAFAERVLRHFNQEEFHYAFDAPLLGLHAVDDFLFETRRGYCEHYASAFAVMMRMAGIPSRVVTGYLGGWYHAFGDYLLVRQSDAHAWTEIWLDGAGWTRVDPTGAVSPLRVQKGSLEAVSGPRYLLDYDWVRRVRNGVDVMQRMWNDWVIDFGAAEQARLLSPLGIKSMSPPTLVISLLVVIAVLSALLLPVVLRIQGPIRRSPVQNAWARFLRRLRRAGVPSRPSMGALDVARIASARLPVDTDDIYRIAGLYNRLRYSPTKPDLRELKAAVNGFRPIRKAS